MARGREAKLPGDQSMRGDFWGAHLPFENCDYALGSGSQVSNCARSHCSPLLMASRKSIPSVVVSVPRSKNILRTATTTKADTEKVLTKYRHCSQSFTCTLLGPHNRAFELSHHAPPLTDMDTERLNNWPQAIQQEGVGAGSLQSQPPSSIAFPCPSPPEGQSSGPVSKNLLFSSEIWGQGAGPCHLSPVRSSRLVTEEASTGT